MKMLHLLKPNFNLIENEAPKYLSMGRVCDNNLLLLCSQRRLHMHFSRIDFHVNELHELLKLTKFDQRRL